MNESGKYLLSKLLNQKLIRYNLPTVIIEQILENISAINSTWIRKYDNNINFVAVNNKENWISKKQILICFNKTSLLTLFAICKIMLSKKNSNINDTVALVYSLPFEHISRTNRENKISDFFDEQLLNLKFDLPSRYLIQTGKLINFGNSAREKYVTHIGIEILEQISINKISKLRMILINYIKWLKLIFIDKNILFIGPEFIIDLNAFSGTWKDKPEILITTQSQILKLPISFKILTNAKKLMFWYSNNSRQIISKSERQSQLSDYSYLNNKHIDIHFVWTSKWAKELAEITNSQVFAIGPILFKKIDSRKVDFAVKKKEKIITVFDVTPKEKSVPTSFYSTINMIDFIKSIISAVDKSNHKFVIQLKNKRRFNKEDSRNYRKFLKTVNNRITIISPNSDVEEVVIESDLVICVPYTSPALIAQKYRIPVVYYWPSNDYLLEKEMDGIRIIIGKEDLAAELNNIIGYP